MESAVEDCVRVEQAISLSVVQARIAALGTSKAVHVVH